MRRLTNREVDQAVSALSPGERRAVFLSVIRACEDDGLSSAEVLRRVASHQYNVHLEDANVKFVDQNGRFIPLKGMKTVNSNKSFYYTQPRIHYGLIYDRLVEHFPKDTKFVTREEFAEQAAALIAEIRADRQMKNLLKGVHLPICLPQIMDGDCGQILKDIFLEALSRSLKQVFHNREFMNWQSDLTHKVTVVDKHHQELIERMQKGPVVGVYFADSLRGFGIEDCRKMARQLPKGYSLSGGFDVATAFVAYPKTMARKHNTPGTDCAALSCQPGEDSLCVLPDGEGLHLDSRYLTAFGRYSAGLLFSR